MLAGEALGALCTQPKHGRVAFGGTAYLENLHQKSPLPTYSPLQPLVNGLSIPVIFLYLRLRGGVLTGFHGAGVVRKSALVFVTPTTCLLLESNEDYETNTRYEESQTFAE